MSFNTNNKVFIREYWNKPLLKFLSKQIGKQLLYLGLPSPKAEDILQWLEYLNSVIAFQCREYGEISHESQSRKNIENLELLLNKLEREKQIENYLIYDGYLEEVVLRGYDNSPTQLNFSLNDFVTLYNLDFCNKISSPLEYIDKNGNLQKAYKFDAINKFLQIQQSFSSVTNKFVLFLTVHCSYDDKELQDFISHPPSKEIKDYIKHYEKLKGFEKNSRIIRLFFAYYIQQQCCVYKFTPKILPSLFYEGIGETSLLHFTVFGIATKNKTAGIPLFQSLTEVLNQKFILINESKFVNENNCYENEKEVELNPVKYFANSKTFSKMWVTKKLA